MKFKQKPENFAQCFCLDGGANLPRRCNPVFDFPKDWNVTHSPKHWSTEGTMLKEIIVPYIETTRDLLGLDSTQSVLVIIDNFRGQITASLNSLLKANNIHVCLLPPNTTGLLQPLDVAVNKDFLRNKFETWYAEEVAKQLCDAEDIQSAEIQPANLSLLHLKI